jgi:hypothetical protein
VGWGVSESRVNTKEIAHRIEEGDILRLHLALSMRNLYHATNGRRRIAQARFFVYRSDDPQYSHTCCRDTVEAGGEGTCQQDLIQGSTMTFN